MPKFLVADELYRLIQRELPEDAYPDGKPADFLSTAESFAEAKVFESAYDTLRRVYDNYFVDTADEKLADFEMKYFGYLLGNTLSIDDRRAKIKAKIQSTVGITKAAMVLISSQNLPLGTDFEIIEWGCGDYGWILDESQLDISTVLNGASQWLTSGADACSKSAADFGISQADLQDIQEMAYTYEVRIYDTTIDAVTRDMLDKALTKGEPARSRHIITDGLSSADKIEGTM